MLNDQKPFWPDNRIYFLTLSTFLLFPYFKEFDQKQLLFDQIKKIENKLGIPVSDFSIAINHCHLKFFLERGLDLAKIKQLIHGGTSFLYKKKYPVKYKEIWGSSRALIVLTEKMHWLTSGYIIGNLLKHKEVNTFEELKNNPFSSYRDFIEKYDEEFAKNLIYQVIKVDESPENEIDINEIDGLELKLPKYPIKIGEKLYRPLRP